MSDCLVTTLKGVVEDDNLPHMGDLTFSVLNPSADLGAKKYLATMSVSFYKETKVVAIGGNFVDANGNSLGTTMTIAAYKNSVTDVFVGANTSKIIFRDALYSLRTISVEKSMGASVLVGSTSQLKWRKDLVSTYIGGLLRLTGKLIDLVNTSLSMLGWGAYLNDGEPITTTLLKKFTNAAYIEFSWLTLEGDLADLRDSKVIYLFVSGCSGPNLKADLATLPAGCTRVIAEYTYTTINFSWESERATTDSPMMLKDIKLGAYVDAMLINQAKLTGAFPSNVSKIISVKGTRTSASDAAVATLQSNGWTITVTPES